MADRTLRLLVESTPKKVFVVALDWPGLARSGKTEEAAIEELLAHLERYRPIAEAVGASLPSGDVSLDVAERVEGGSGTAFGVPSTIVEADREPVPAAEAQRQAALVEAAWSAFDRIAAAGNAFEDRELHAMRRRIVVLLSHEHEVGGRHSRHHGLEVDESLLVRVVDAVGGVAQGAGELGS